MQFTHFQRFSVLYSLQKSFLGQFSADESNMYNGFIILYTNQEKGSPSEISGSYEFHTFMLCKVPQLFDLAEV